MARMKASVDVAFASGHGRRMLKEAASHLQTKGLKEESRTARRKREEREAKARRLAEAKARMEGER